MKIIDWLMRNRAGAPAPARVEPVATVRERRRMPKFISQPRADLQEKAERLFQPYTPPPGVRGADAAPIAMDTGLSSYMGANYGIVSNFIADGLNFKGYADLAAMMLRAEFRKPVDVIAKEATREWIKFRSIAMDVSSDDKQVSAKIRELEREFQRLRVRDVVHRQIVHALGFGIGHVWIGIKGKPLTSEGQSLPLQINANGVTQGSLDRIVNVDPIWTNPNTYNADNPLRSDYYRPENWWVQGVLVHHSRLLTVVPYEVPDILKPAFNFGGLSLTQQLEAYVHNFLRTRQSTSDLVSNFATKVLKTDMTGNMQANACMEFGDIDADSVTGRVAAMNAWQSNNGTFVVDKENEDFTVVSAPLGTLDTLQAQSQEFMASIPGIPLVKLFGIQPQGLNASSDGEIRVFYDEIAAFQAAHVAPTVRAIFNLAQINLWGEIDETLDFEFVRLWQLSEKEAAEVEKLKTDADAVNVQAGIISAEEARERQAGDPQSSYRNVSLTGPPPDPPDPETDGGGLSGLLKRSEESE